jgi:hypothetical protein
MKAPDWVIEMMKTGEPVRCKCRADNQANYEELMVCGYDISPGAKYRTIGGRWWPHAEPLPKWQPKDGEAVLFGCSFMGKSTYAGVYFDGVVYFRDGNMAAADCTFIPFNASQAGKPWSEVGE